MIGESLYDAEKIRKSISSSDAILALIEDDCDSYFKSELQMALSVLYNQRKIFIPIRLNNSPILDELKDIQHLNLNPDSSSDLSRAQTQLARLFFMRNEKKRHTLSKISYMITLTITIEAMCILVPLMFYGNLREFRDSIFGIIVSIISVFFSVTTLVTSYISIVRRKRQEDNEEEIESYSRRLKNAIISVPEEEKDKKELNITKENKQNIDALGRMLINLEDIKEFYTWSQKQAKASFALAVVTCVLGFLLMCVAVVLPVAFKLQLQMAIIPAVGGGITELVAGTALIVYKNSLKQLNHYHKALHEDERFLSSVNLIGKFNNIEVQDEMLKEIIRSEIQMNLSTIQMNNVEKQE